MRKVRTGGGWPALFYTLRKAREAGGLWRLWNAMRSKNACKTCALGMGGQQGGMVNERGVFPEVCKKSFQAMVADMQDGIRPEFWQTYSVAQLKAFSPRELENCGRLAQPVVLRRGQQYFEPITWDAALSRVVTKLKEVTPEETFWYFSGRSSNEAAFLLQMFARVYGTNNVNNCSFYCHQASGVGLQSALGISTATVTLNDVEHADCLFLIGGNPASNHPRLMTTLKHLRRRGGEVIVINPIVETGLVNFSVPSDPWSLMFGTKIASLYVQPHIGGDLALLMGLAKRIVELGAHDLTYLSAYCDDWPKLQQRLAELSWDEVLEKSGVSQAEINEISGRYAKSKKVVFAWTMGITHHTHGVENVEAIANLALLRGMVGQPGCGLMPIRGHSNVQGIGSVGVTPKLKDAVFDGLERHFGVKLPTTPGLDTMACMEGADRSELKFGLCLGGNLYGSNPDAAFAERSLSRLQQLVYLSTTLNTGHAWGLAEETIILPVLARDEEPEPTTQESMFNYVRLSDGGPARHSGPRSEIDIIASVAHDVLPTGSPIDWNGLRRASHIRTAIGKIVPGYEQIATIDQTKEEFQIPGRTFHTPHFPTATGRAQLRVHTVPPLQGTGEELRLMTIRSEGQFNTVVYEEYDLYRGIDRRDVLLMHPEDLTSRNLVDGDLLEVTSATGTMRQVRATAFSKIRAGNVAMYYPEANVLVPRTSDPRSKTPAFKLILVRIKKDTPTQPGVSVTGVSRAKSSTQPAALPVLNGR